MSVPYHKFKVLVFGLASLACVFGPLSGAHALLLGLFLTLALGNPALDRTRKWMQPCLAYSVVGLGAGMNLWQVVAVGRAGFFLTAVTIAGGLIFGIFLGRALRLSKVTGLLISTGTAICGGSAIAAIAATIRAKPEAVSISVGIVFLLNAVALFTFPTIGHWFGLSEPQFGLWSALAIHDTSSVVGASMQYGAEALRIATTVKLARALWILPVTLIVGFWWNEREFRDAKGKRPWFIVGFLVMAALATQFPNLRDFWEGIAFWAKRFLILALFLVGANLNRRSIAAVGFRPLLHGIILWLISAAGSLWLVRLGYLRVN